MLWKRKFTLTLKHRITAFVSTKFCDGLTYTVRHGLLTGMRRRGGLGWIPTAHTDTPEEAFWRALDLRDKVIYDVGAFHGLLSLWFARTARQVISFEPTAANRKRLLENLRLNQIENVTVRPYGLASADAEVELVYSPLMPGGATAAPTLAESIRSDPKATIETIIVKRLDDENAPVPDLIKVDVEGLELEVLQGAAETLRRHKPALYLEMHGETMADKRRKVTDIVAYLTASGYTNIRHIESASAITPANAERAAEGHLYCTAS